LSLINSGIVAGAEYTWIEEGKKSIEKTERQLTER
jgi:hypothetical protein